VDRSFDLGRLADLPFAYKLDSLLDRGYIVAFMEASASASGGMANGVVTGAGAHRSVGLDRGTRARMCLGRDSVGLGRGTRATMCFGRDMA